MVRLFVAGGKALQITPSDLVGAIANETGLSGQAIGAIRIEERHATVEVPRESADLVIAALGKTKIKGKHLRAEIDRFG